VCVVCALARACVFFFLALEVVVEIFGQPPARTPARCQTREARETGPAVVFLLSYPAGRTPVAPFV
jgi:hypothetical protein